MRKRDRSNYGIQNTINTLSALGTEPKRIIAAVRQANPTAAVVDRDIYNQRVITRSENLAGRTSLEALVENLSTHEDWHTAARIIQGHLTAIFFATNNMINLLLRECIATPTVEQ